MPSAEIKDLLRLPLPAFAAQSVAASGWLTALRAYLATTGTLNLVWETVQLPLYAIWAEGTAGSKVFAVVHCTAGDLLIALSVLTGALMVAGVPAWPGQRFRRVAALTMLGGLAYTLFSEWLNVEVRRSWAYSDLMPVLPPLGTGLSPLLQWVVIPVAALWMASRAGSARRRVQR